VEIIEKDETDYYKKDDRELIYLDRIVDEEEMKSDKKGKLEKAISRFDKKINPVTLIVITFVLTIVSSFFGIL